MMLWIAVAIALSMWMIQCLIEKLSSVTSRGSRIGSYIGGCGVYQFALFLGFIVGGNFVGAVGDNFIGDTGTVLGIGIFIFYVTIVACSTGALIGFLPGGLTQRFTR